MGTAGAVCVYTPVATPYSNVTEVLLLFGFTLPFKVAPLAVTLVAGVVVACGALAINLTVATY
jgi:hypothetical protein